MRFFRINTGMVLAGALFSCLFLPIASQAQTRMTLDEAIGVARTSSVAALEAKASFVSSYWAWRSYKASRLPSLNLYGNLASFDRSLRQLQNFETGELVYTGNYNMQNSIGLSISQNIGFTGGRLSIYTDLSRIDQFGVDAGKTWYAQPVTLYYEQPLLAYNRFKWEKKISPRQYERAKRVYTLLGFDEKFEIETVTEDVLPDIRMDYDLVMAKALENSSFRLENEIEMLTAESDIAQAKADRGASVSIGAKFGLSNSDAVLRKTYGNLLDQEVVGITFSIPIFDWGMGKGRVKEAEAKAAVIKAQVEQSENDYRRNIFTAVGQFNSQRQQCMASARAESIAQERYSLVMERFRSGSVSVTDLNTARSECDEAFRNYIDDLMNFWNYYYSLRKLTLYDFIAGKDIDVNVEELAE